MRLSHILIRYVLLCYFPVLQIQTSTHCHRAWGRPHHRRDVGSSVRGTTRRPGARYWALLRGVRDVRSPDGWVAVSTGDPTAARWHDVLQQPASGAWPPLVPTQRRSASPAWLLPQHRRIQESTAGAGDKGRSWTSLRQTCLQPVLVMIVVVKNPQCLFAGMAANNKQTENWQVMNGTRTL